MEPKCIYNAQYRLGATINFVLSMAKFHIKTVLNLNIGKYHLIIQKIIILDNDKPNKKIQ